ncbi:MAG TPA: hypothetical protein VFQ85_07790 [Mycobacteriales bacterium]|nr:hypothetical protein [Mycobacteriales bacterium]
MTEPVRRAANDVADWLELVALTRGAAVSGDALAELAAAAGIRGADVGLGTGTMARRSALLGEAYPFRVAGGGIAALPHAGSTPWTALLLLTPGVRGGTSLRLEEAAVHLEQVTGAALDEFFGPGTQVLRFAWPSDEGRPQEFSSAVRWLAERMGAPLGSAYRPPYRKDGGVDVVAWRPFVDRRSGFPVLLAQCTLEQDYEHKAGDIDLRVWDGWLSLDVDPMTALAVPGVVPAGEPWNRLAARTLILDRPRLAGLLAGRPQPERLLPALRWAAAEVERLRAAS